MSAIIHRRTVHVAITAQEAADELAGGPHDVQCAFLDAFAANVNAWTFPHSWPMQCRLIVDEMTPETAAAVALALSTLQEHLAARSKGE